MKRILVPCDFSDTAIEAFKFAVSTTLQEKGELHVLYVLDMTSIGGSSSLSHAYAFNIDFLRDMEQESEQKFQKMWERYSPMTLRVIFRHHVGSLVQQVIQYIDQNSIDLVMMGTKGTSRLKYGSNVEKIVRYSPVPVISLRKNADKPIKTIVFPVTLLDRPDEIFIEELKKLQHFFGADLHLLYINTPVFFKRDLEMKNLLENYARQFTLSDYRIFFRSDTTVQEGIENFLKETKPDMLAMGTHAWKSVGHFVFGSFTEDVVNQIETPVWTYVLD